MGLGEGSAERHAQAMRRTISIRGISKSFGETKANSNISFEIAGGTIHGLVGQNGAGKSTLMKLLFGLERPDSGTFLLGEQPLQASSPREALARGIGLVAQELALIDELSALDNLMLGNEPTRLLMLDRTAALARARSLESQLGFALPWDQPVSELSIAQKQQVEVLRLLLLGADTLIFDEPTAALAPPQVESFLELLRRLAAEGHTIVFISHKLREVFAVCDEITVLRDGWHVGTVASQSTDIEHISNLMVGADLQEAVALKNTPGDVVLSVRRIAHRDKSGIHRLHAVTAEFSSHAITGICGVTGNGQEEFMKVLAGVLRLSEGEILLRDLNLSTATVKGRRAAKIAYVPADRKSEGLAQSGSVLENCIAGFQRLLARMGWLSAGSAAKHAERLLSTFDVVHGALEAPVSTLSGGNQQKLMLGREVLHEPEVLLASQPTRGVDIGGIQTIHQMLRAERDRGAAVLLESEDLDELLLLSDEVIVFYGGSIAGRFQRPFDRQAIGNAMVGAHAHVA